VEYNPEKIPLPVAKTLTAKRTVRFTDQPQVFDLPPTSTREDKAGVAPLAKNNDDGIHNGRSEGDDAQHTRARGKSSTPSADEAGEIAAATATNRDHGVCPPPCSSNRPRRSISGARTTCSGADTEAAKEADIFIAPIINGFRGAGAEVFPPPPPTRSGTNRPTLDSWENYL